MKIKLKSEMKFDAGLEPSSNCYCSDGGGSAPAPDYTPMAQASEEAARIGAELGREQLAESKRQYDQNYEVAKKVSDAQLGIMNETNRQGKDYYDYMVAKQRPVEDALNADAMASGGQTAQDDAAAKAVADSQGGYTRALNQGLRQARRYGLGPVTTTGGLALSQAQSTAAAAGTAREKEKNLGYAKKMDVAGLYRGMPGASQGAYGLAINAGNAANSNQMAPGSALLNGMAQGAGMQQTGMGQKVQGLGSILNSQTSMYNASMANQGGSDPFAQIAGAALGGWAGGGFKMPGSDRRVKTLIESVGVDERTGLTLYEFNYIDDPDHRYRGVMADEVKEFMPEAVVRYEGENFDRVDYSKLGIEMVEV
jgi:hypothetical protein